MNNNQGQQPSNTNETFIIGLIMLAITSYMLTLFPGFIAPTLIKLNYIVDSSWTSFLSGALNIIFEPDYAALQDYYFKRKEADFLMVWSLNSRLAVPTMGAVTLVYLITNIITNIKLKRAVVSTDVLSIEELITLQVKDCKYMRPVAIEDRPDKCSLTDGRWARAMRPYEFLKHHEISLKEGEYDKEKTEQALIDQLGKTVSTIEEIYQWAPSSKIILCIMIYRIMVLRDESNELIDRAAYAWNFNKKTNVVSFNDAGLIKEINILLHRKDFIKEIEILLSMHGYVNTLIVGALDQARNQSGKLSTPEFLWLRPTNRVLFYALNQLGRKEAWIESVAVTAHFQVEQHYKKASHEAHITPAVTLIQKLSTGEYEKSLIS